MVMAFNFFPFSQWLSSLVLLFLPVLLFLLKQKLTAPPKEAKLPPGPIGLPIIGSLHRLGNLPHVDLRNLAAKYGPVMMLKLGNIPTLVVSNADYAKEVLQTHDIDFSSRPHMPGGQKLSYGYLDVAFSPATHYRSEMRKLFSFELLKAKREKSLWAAREDEVEKMIKGISAGALNPVNLNEFIFALVDGIVGQVAFGRSYGAMQFNGQKFTEVIEEVLVMLDGFFFEDFFPSVGKYLDSLTGRQRRLEKSFKNLDGYFSMILDAHLDPKRPPPEVEDLVDVLINLMRDGSNEFPFTKENVKAVLMNAFVGGIDTSAVAIVWGMSEVFMNPRILKKAQAELRAIGGGKPRLDESDMAKLDYVKLVVKETLRLHTPLNLLIPREVMRHCKIGPEGYDVFPKTRVLVNIGAINRDPNYWDQPEKFIPERFEDTGIEFRGGHFQFLPFGSGRRICPGMAMGATTVTFAMANLLYCFDWELPDGMTRADVCMDEGCGLTVHKKTPLILKPIRYNGQKVK